MISVEDAKLLVEQHCPQPRIEKKSLFLANGQVLAGDVHANYDIPFFNQSSMDGYAFRFEDWKQRKKITISATMQAGNTSQEVLKPGTAARIYTGAAVPEGADTVIMQEKTEVQGNQLLICDEAIQPGAFLRPKGSEIKSGECALPAGTKLSPAAVGFLAAIGTSEVQVYTFPKVLIIITGNELQVPGNPLKYGQVYDGNSYALQAALTKWRIPSGSCVYLQDDPGLLQKALEAGLDKNDIVITTGGASVGDFDFLLEAVEKCRIQPLFHNVKQRPGKPLFFGKKDDRIVFGLPGNPASVLTCFYEYVTLAIERMTGLRNLVPVRKVRLAVDWQKKAGLTHFLKGCLEEDQVFPLYAQESYRMRSYAHANCLIRLEEDATVFAKGDWVEVHEIPA
jgi:molybdopterin molybdotransferase